MNPEVSEKPQVVIGTPVSYTHLDVYKRQSVYLYRFTGATGIVLKEDRLFLWSIFYWGGGSQILKEESLFTLKFLLQK